MPPSDSISSGETGSVMPTSLLISSRIVGRISDSGQVRTISPLAKMTPLPRPPATPMSASRDSPGPLTTQPITATLIGLLIRSRYFSTRSASAIRSISTRPQVGQATIVAPRWRRLRPLRISKPV